MTNNVINLSEVRLKKQYGEFYMDSDLARNIVSYYEQPIQKEDKQQTERDMVKAYLKMLTAQIQK